MRLLLSHAAKYETYISILEYPSYETGYKTLEVVHLAVIC
jgi:hypothetical protein